MIKIIEIIKMIINEKIIIKVISNVIDILEVMNEKIIKYIQECKGEGMYRTAPRDKVRLEYPRQFCADLQISGDNNSSIKFTSTTKNHILPHTKHYIICN